MPQLVNCPHCQKQLNVPENLLGKTVKCPSCQNTFTATAASGGVQEPAAPAAPKPRSNLADAAMAGFDEGMSAGTGGGGGGNLRPHRGVIVLILGIASIIVLCCGVTFWLSWPLGGVAIFLGNADKKAMDAGEMDPAGRGMTQIGFICGIVGIVLSILTMCGTCGFFGISAMSGGSGH